MDNGETSKKKSADLSENDKPLKKARYLWQVKGKYHLKDNLKNDLNKDPKPDLQPQDNINNNNISCNKNLYNDRSCIEALIANSDKMDFPDRDSPKNLDKSISDEIPITLVKPNVTNEDYYLRKWQARQIARGFVDNTINKVLEGWMVAPFDAADFVENCENEGQIVDEGILMAIQSHGLQSGTNLNLLASKNSKNLWDTVANCSCTSSRKTLPKPVTPFHQRESDNNISLEYYENLCVLKDTEPIATNYTVTTSYNDQTDDCVDMDTSISQTDHDMTDDYDALNDTDFLDAAVAVAIQKKGLTLLNCVDCG